MLCKNCGQDNPPEARFCAKCGTALVTLYEPGVGSSYSNGWTQLWKHFWKLLLILIITCVIIIVGSGISTPLPIFSPFYIILVILPLYYGMAFAFLKAARGGKPEIKDLFAGFQNYWNTVLAGLLVGIIIGIGVILLIIPGIIFACKLAFTPYLVVDRKMGVIEAIKESWRMTSGGRSWKVFLIGLQGIPIFIAGLICLGVGVIISFMWISMAMASLYHAVSTSGAVSNQLEQAGPPQPAT